MRNETDRQTHHASPAWERISGAPTRGATSRLRHFVLPSRTSLDAVPDALVARPAWSDSAKEVVRTMDLTYETAQHGGWTVMSVVGEIDVYSAAQLREPLNALVDQPDASVVLNLEAVEFLDSMGLRVIVGAHKRAAAVGSSFALLCTRAPLLSILRVTGLDDVITVYDALPSGSATG